jgi:hypothetical protein
MRRNIVIVAVALVVLAAIGSAMGKSQPSASPATVIASPVPTATASAETAAPVALATPAATPEPTPRVLLSLSGNGIKTTKSFRASGDSVDLVYAFNCAAFGSQGNFAVMFYGASLGGPALPDILVNALAAKGSDTSTEYLNGAPGPFHLAINSECAWTVKVTGTP